MTVFVLVLLSVACSAVAQGLLKHGMSQPAVLEAVGAGGLPRIALAVAASPWVAGGLALYALGALLWLAVLARLDLSMAYPFVALGFVLTMLIGALVFNEPVGAARIAGTALIVAGVLVVARS